MVQYVPERGADSFFIGYRRIIISTAAVAAIMLAASIILDISANCIKKSGLNQQ